MARTIPPSEMFDVEGSPHAALFEGLTNCWEALGPRLAGYLRDWLARQEAPLLRGVVMPGAHLMSEDVFLGEGSVIEPGAYVKGPAVIGRGTEVRHGAYVRGDVLVGDGCVVGHTTEIKGSIMLDGAKAGHFAYVGDSIVGRGANLGAGTKLANFKLTADEIVLRIDGDRVPTGWRKLGALLGDGCQTGCNSVTSPGTLLGRGSFVYPCVSVAPGLYPAGTRLKR